MRDKFVLLLTGLNFCVAVGLLLPLALTDFPDTFVQIGSIPASEMLTPGGLGLMLIQLLLIALSAALVFIGTVRAVPPLVRWVTFAVVAASIVVSVLSPYWLGQVSLIQNLW